MKNLAFLPVLIILGLLQCAFWDYFRIFNIGADLLFAAVIIAGLCMDLKWAVLIGLCAGIIKDSLLLGSFGMNTFMFTLWGFLIAQISRKISIEDNFRRICFSLIAALIQNILCAALLYNSGSVVPVGIALRVIFVGSIYTALTSPLIFKIIEKCQG